MFGFTCFWTLFICQFGQSRNFQLICSFQEVLEILPLDHHLSGVHEHEQPPYVFYLHPLHVQERLLLRSFKQYSPQDRAAAIKDDPVCFDLATILFLTDKSDIWKVTRGAKVSEGGYCCLCKLVPAKVHSLITHLAVRVAEPAWLWDSPLFSPDLCGEWGAKNRCGKVPIGFNLKFKGADWPWNFSELLDLVDLAPYHTNYTDD